MNAQVRRLGVAIHNAYMREMGGPQFVWDDDDPTTLVKTSDLSEEQMGRWDRIAIDVISNIQELQ